MKIRIHWAIVVLLPLLKVTETVPQLETVTLAANQIQAELIEDDVSDSNQLVEPDEIPTATMPGITNRKKPSRRRKYKKKHSLRTKTGKKKNSRSKV